ncbi:hypothetical protein [Afifella sp. IM 167]|uniref:hypothetical protein n=1 Tax=Afifella sp. IM 167 TaxID=2033586 RepID=UPI001CCF1DE1|nr:hypothetical protein [Afifella sp. IM 167]MBZ8135080.1 hypothetical protein [Afifella sp. IM 167]
MADALDRAFFNPLDPRDRAERGRGRAAEFRRLHMMAAVAWAMGAFVLLAVWRPGLALPWLGAVIAGPILLLGAAMGLRLLLSGSGGRLPGPSRLVLLSGLVFAGFALGSFWLGVPAALAALVVVLLPLRRAGGAG